MMAGLVATAAGIGVLALNTAADAGSKVKPHTSPPPKPPPLPWINSDGSVNEKKREETVMVVGGPDGKPNEERRWFR